jgi:hypothetical protein
MGGEKSGSIWGIFEASGGQIRPVLSLHVDTCAMNVEPLLKAARLRACYHSENGYASGDRVFLPETPVAPNG